MGEVYDSKEAANIVDLLQHTYQTHGKPKCILSDNGGEFTAAVFVKLHDDLGIEVAHGLPYHPQTQGMT